MSYGAVPQSDVEAQSDEVGCWGRRLNYGSNCYTFGSGEQKLATTHTYAVPLRLTKEVTLDFVKFLSVMLGKAESEFRWIRGPGNTVGSVIEYTYASNGTCLSTIQEELLERTLEDEVVRLKWKNVHSEPALPLNNYEATWEMTAGVGPNNGDVTRVHFSRRFDEILVWGFIPIGSMMRNSFEETNRDILSRVFLLYWSKTYPKLLPHKKSAKIAIVGAGPSGLHMGFQLWKRGYKNLTFLEKTGRYGGKTLSIPDETNQGHIDKGKLPAPFNTKIIHELGTCYLSPSYDAVRALFEELVTNYDLPDDTFRTVRPDSYTIRTDGQTDKTFDEWVISLSQVTQECDLCAPMKLRAPELTYGVAIYNAKQKFNRLHEEYFGTFSYTMPPPLSTKTLNELDMSFQQWLVKNDLQVLVPLLAYANTAQGYGTLDDTPAFFALSWVTPGLLDGYIRTTLLPNVQALPGKKEMLVKGWIELWDQIIKITGFGGLIKYNVAIDSISRANDVVTIKYNGGETETFDYLVVAAPIHLDAKKPIMDLTQQEKDLFHKNLDHSQFRTILYKAKVPQPYLDTHLTIYSDKLVGPSAGDGHVFAFRDSYLAINSNLQENTPEHQSDPNRWLEREQMCYQYVKNNVNESTTSLTEKSTEFLDETFGKGKYEILLPPKSDPSATTWDYFYRYDQDGLRKRKTWELFSIQGQKNTFYAHASNYFESVLDIINYQNCALDSMQGVIGKEWTNEKPGTDAKPDYHDDYVFRARVTLTNCCCGLFAFIFNIIFIPLYFVFWPINEYFTFRLIRWFLQWAFRSEDIGWFFSMSMDKFIDVSPSARALHPDQGEDAIVTLLYKGENSIGEQFSGIIKRPTKSALEWNWTDFRVMIKEWIVLVDNRLIVMPGFVQDMVRFMYVYMPLTYSWLVTLITAAFFTQITGFGYRVNDDKGGGFFIPRCHMIRRARAKYPDMQATAICTKLCKVFSEETMKYTGIPLVFEPNLDQDGSCMVRGAIPRECACADNSLLDW